MYYQVVERYRACRCLYHQHSIDPCSAYGQRGHSVQEKTALVGFSYSSHDGLHDYQRQKIQVKIPTLITDNDSSDDSDNVSSVFSNEVAVSRATSFISAKEDTIQDILQFLIEDPLLRWENLIGQHKNNHTRSEMKDVQFFLRAFEMDIRTNADDTVESQVDASFRQDKEFHVSRQIFSDMREDSAPKPAAGVVQSHRL
ncbi:hypothetical protein HBI45_044420 [Parastagonospora nodorum]|nr:hypothetical protein HBI45_044420 [Parastagonospora nodorum]